MKERNYKICYQHKGRTQTKYFSTLEVATAAASEVFNRTGVVLGIEAVQSKQHRQVK